MMGLQRIECRSCFAPILYEPQSPQPGVFCTSCGSLALGDTSVNTAGWPIEAAPPQPPPTAPAPVPVPAAPAHTPPGSGSGKRQKMVLIAGAVAVLLIVGVGVPMTLFDFFTSGVRGRSATNLNRIGLAIDVYNNAYGKLPADTHAPDGKPGLSWRVELLPYLEEDNLYQEFRKHEPWNSPHNASLLKRMPRVFAAPGREKEAAEGLTIYQGFNSPGAVFESHRPQPLTMDMIEKAHGRSDTILVIEATDAVPWTRPIDVRFLAGRPYLSDFPKGSINAAFCDGKVRVIRTGQADFLERIARAIRVDGEKSQLEVRGE
jgi:hypothetical protein